MNPRKQKTKVDELRNAYKTRMTHRKDSPHAVNEIAPADKPADQLEEQIKAAEEEAKHHYDKLLRVMAEFENFKKRIEKEKSEHLQYSNEKLLTNLLPVLDDFDRVLDHLPNDGGAEVQAIADGVTLVHKNMVNTLGKFGLEEVGAPGQPFDPNVHEAIATDDATDASPDTITALHRKGYRLNDRLLRAALVTVAK